MNKIALLTLVAFVAGFLVNKIVPSSAPPASSIQCANLTAAKNDLIAISQNEYLEYTQIKDLKQKYEKADELLGKMMLLFLADIGFKVTKVSIGEMEVKNAEPEIISAKIESVNSAEPAPVAITNAAAENPTSTNESLKGKSGVIRNLKTQAQIDEALEKVLIENPKLAVAGGNPVNQQQMKIIEGSFTGEVKFFDKRREVRNVSWELVSNYQEKSIQTEFQLRMFGGSEGESKASGRGELRHVSILAEDPYAYMVETCGGDCYLQMYYNVIHDQFFGNFYESKGGSKKFERVGLVNLRR